VVELTAGALPVLKAHDARAREAAPDGGPARDRTDR